MSNYESQDEALIGQVASAFAAMEIQPAPALSECTALREVRMQQAIAIASHESLYLPRTRLRRILAGGMGITVVAGLLVAIVLSRTTSLSAMERTTQVLRELKSYSYKLSSATTESAAGGKRTTTWSEDGEVYWQAPNAFRFEDKIVRREVPPPAGGPGEEVLEHFVEVFQQNKAGLLIDHQRKTFFREEFMPIGSATYPWQPLEMIRSGKGKVIRELGTKTWEGKQARGYVVRFASGDPPRHHDWHVWVDPATDLPLQIGYTVDDQKEPRTTTVLRATDFRWNPELASTLFAAAVPEGYREKLADEPLSEE